MVAGLVSWLLGAISGWEEGIGWVGDLLYSHPIRDVAAIYPVGLCIWRRFVGYLCYA